MSIPANQGAVKTVAISLHQVLADLVTLKSPAVSAAVVGFIVALVPGLNVGVVTLTAIVAGVGVLASVVENITGA